MLQGETAIFPAATEAKNESLLTSLRVCAGKNSKNFEKYEGKTESVVEGNLCDVAWVTVGKLGLIGESGAIFFSSAKKFLKTVHILLTTQLLSPRTAGLRLRTVQNFDKKKSEFYFLKRGEKHLTKKIFATAPRKKRK